jgi:chromate transporter
MDTDEHTRSRRFIEVFLTFLWLGLTSFGGPVAHLGYFRRVFVERRQWLTEDEYAEIIALCQFLPGPASSQTGFLIGLRQAGWTGALAAWLAFTLPSALLMFGFAVMAPKLTSPLAQGVIHGLKLVAVAVVAQAVWSMGKKLCTDRLRISLALAAFLVVLLVAAPGAQLFAIGGGLLLGLILCRNIEPPPSDVTHPLVKRRVAVVAGLVFTGLLITLPVAASANPHSSWALANIFYRAGTLVFGGGHVVLPLLRDALVPAHWINDQQFLAGYGAAQAMPGPLFTFSAYLGATVTPNWGQAATAALALTMIFLPGFLLVLLAYPFWSRLRNNRLAQAGLAGVNAAVVGILGAALYNPVWVSAVFRPFDLALVVTSFLLLERWQAPPLAIVLLCAVGGIAQA